mmetsp:Transcript_4547/g.10643  ORF Transcript_4547/g.10643 Transcript_4547/m.10643 type:complete len:264 (+) Transcript_4547:113-904(+)
MPPRKYKTDHRRGGGAGSKHVSSFDEVKARNAGEESAYDKARAARAPAAPAAPKKKEEVEESEESEEEEVKPGRKQKSEVFGEVCNPNAAGYNHVDKHGVELTRKQREEIDRQAARRRYEELHKAGKTAEAQADLKRLEEVKKRREEAARKRAEEQAAKAGASKDPKEDAKAVGKAALMKELKQAMGKEEDEAAPKSKDEQEPAEAQKEGDTASPKKKLMNGADLADVYSFVASDTKVKEEGTRFKETDGTIEACRAAEADFM